MTDIPEDVMKAAHQVIESAFGADRENYSWEELEAEIARAILAERERREAYIHMLETMNMRGGPSPDEVEALHAAMARYDLLIATNHQHPANAFYGMDMPPNERSEMLARGQTVAD